MKFDHSDPIHAPTVKVLPATPGTNEIHATLYYYDVAVDLNKVDKVNQAANDIVAFFEEAEKDGLFKVVE